MDVKFLSASQTQTTLIALVKKCESMQWAVAWATDQVTVEEIEQRSRLEVWTTLATVDSASLEPVRGQLTNDIGCRL